jgi:hypothetical protein
VITQLQLMNIIIIIIIIKIRPVGAELFHADRRTDMTKLTIAFRNFANAPQNKGNTSIFLFYIP